MSAAVPVSQDGDLERPSDSHLKTIVSESLKEDLGGELRLSADLTTDALISAGGRASGTILSRQNGVVAGLDVARMVFSQLDNDIRCDSGEVEDSSPIVDGASLLHIQGAAAALLTGERTALNFLQHLSGIATLTKAYVVAVSHTSAQITDTRKTAPGLRELEKYAVRCGGGVSHRHGLHDAILIKENHAVLSGGVADAVRQVREANGASPSVPVMVEATDLEEIGALLSLPDGIVPDRILLDNMTTGEMADSAQLIRDRSALIAIEATGGITLANVRPVAETGVDYISIGALTHSAPALDMTLLFG